MLKSVVKLAVENILRRPKNRSLRALCLFAFALGCGGGRARVGSSTSGDSAPPSSDATKTSSSLAEGLTEEESRELVALKRGLSTMGVEFPHCHHNLPWGHFGKEVEGERLFSEKELASLEASPDREELIEAGTRGYARRTYSVWRKLLALQKEGKRQDAPRIRKLLQQKMRLEDKLFRFLTAGNNPDLEDWELYAYELALHHLWLQDFDAAHHEVILLIAQSSHAHPVPPMVQLLLGMSGLAEPAGEQQLQAALSTFDQLARGNSSNPYVLAGHCYRAEILLRLGEEQVGIAAFRMLRELAESSEFAHIAQRRLEELGVQ